MQILKLEQLVKQYANHRAVDGVSFEVPKGRIFGLLGPNGAGKTSIIRMITTITSPDGGQIFFNGEPLNASHPAQIGYMPEERGLYKKMAVGEHLLYLAQLKNMPKKRAQEALKFWFEKFGILDWWDKKVQELSKGMQQKIQFIATVVHEPKLLILDEPFSGLDPINTQLIQQEIYALHEQGTSIIFSTHRMEQVEEICEYIVLINKGKNVLEGDVAQIKQDYKENLFQIHYEGVFPDDLAASNQIIEHKNQKITIQLQEAHTSNQMLKQLLDRGVYIHSFKEILPTLNEIFIKRVSNTY